MGSLEAAEDLTVDVLSCVCTLSPWACTLQWRLATSSGWGHAGIKQETLATGGHSGVGQGQEVGPDLCPQAAAGALVVHSPMDAYYSPVLLGCLKSATGIRPVAFRCTVGGASLQSRHSSGGQLEGGGPGWCPVLAQLQKPVLAVIIAPGLWWGWGGT